MNQLSRRGILGAIICAPAIVRASSLMPVKELKLHRNGYPLYIELMNPDGTLTNTWELYMQRVQQTWNERMSQYAIT